jgi:high-affinity K+ transport system ATPase subunit B
MENRNMQVVKFQSKAEKKDNLMLKALVITAGIAILLPFWSIKIIVLLIIALIWFYPDGSKNLVSKLTRF